MYQGISISFELRPCIVTWNGSERKALFHMFSYSDRFAVVEFEDGECSSVAACDIRFVDNKIGEYVFGDSVEHQLDSEPCEYCSKERKPIDWKFCPKCGRDLLTK